MAKATRQAGASRPKPVKKSTSPKPKAGRKTSPKKTTRRSGNVRKGFHGKSALAMVVFGPPKVGKTAFAAHFPKPGFLFDPQEEGIADLVEFNQAPEPIFQDEVKDWSALLSALEDVAAGQYDVETLVIDSLTGMEKLCFIHHCSEYFEDDWSSRGFYSYQQGPKNAAKTDWPEFLDAVDAIRKAGINVILVAHSVVKNFANPEGADYERFIPYLDKDIWQATHRWAKAVLFYNYHVEVDTTKKRSVKNKAKMDTEQRFIYADWSPAFDAGNRYGLDPLMDAGGNGKDAFDAFDLAFREAAGV